MTNKKQAIIIFALILCFQQFANAQSNQNDQFLQNVGALDSLYSESLKEHRKFYVQFPDYYEANSNRKYPVVFILDGDVLLPTVNNVHGFYSGGFMPEAILVGISNANNRTRDLTTSAVQPFNEENGGADNFTKFIQTELIPFVENKYPVTKFRTLIGHSYGGLFTINALINHPELFSNYIAIDPSLDWDDQKLLGEAAEKLQSQDYKGKSLFMSLGGQLHMQNPQVTIENVMDDTSDFTLSARSNITFSNMVKQNHKNGLAFEWKFYPRDLHGTIPYPSIMDGLIFNFAWFQMEHTDKFNSPETSKEELFKIVNYRAEKLESHFNYAEAPYPEDLLNVLGYMSLEMEQMEKSKMFFEFAIQFYPTSAKTYDSMADFYEKNNDYDTALKFATKAFEINGGDYFKQRIEALKGKQ